MSQGNVERDGGRQHPDKSAGVFFRPGGLENFAKGARRPNLPFDLPLDLARTRPQTGARRFLQAGRPDSVRKTKEK